MKANSSKILIAEWIPSLNKGELAILIGMMKTFEILDGYEVTAFSFTPRLDLERFPDNVKILDVGRDLFLESAILDNSRRALIKTFIFSLFLHSIFILLCIVFGTRAKKIMNKSIWKAYCESDAYIVCHNGVNCVHGFILPFSPIYISIIGRILRKPVIIYGNGTSNLKRKLWEKLAVRVLKSMSLITIRDVVTNKYLDTLCPNLPNKYLTGDPAVLVDPASEAIVEEIMIVENIPNNRNPLIGVTMTNATLMNSTRLNTSLQNKASAISEYAQFFDNLIETLDAIIIFIPHCIEFYGERDDRKVANLILQSMKNKNSVRSIEKEYSTEELKGLMGRFDFIVGARIHSVISALTMGVPALTLATSTDERAKGLIAGLLEQGKWIHHVEEMNAGGLYSHAITLWNEKENIKIELAQVVERARKKAMLNGILLRALFDQAYSKFV